MFAIARTLFIQTKNRLENVRKTSKFTKIREVLEPFCQNNDICAKMTIYNAPSNMNSKTPLK